ncbi:MAG TPA: hypothetical protein VFD48_11290 [Pyrinomonadaceae bacterium]|nr:hypothetical protein [Pyrinomonadaceae bacterium]
MRSVTVWACGCSVRYKAIGQTGYIPEHKSEVVCPHCGTATQILGTAENILEEVAEGEWRIVRLNSHTMSA